MYQGINPSPQLISSIPGISQRAVVVGSIPALRPISTRESSNVERIIMPYNHNRPGGIADTIQRCRRCRTLCYTIDNFCPCCGDPVRMVVLSTRATPTQATPTQATPTRAISRKHPHCHHCREPITHPVATFCPHCGTKIISN